MSILDMDISEQMDIKVFRSCMQQKTLISRVIHPVGQGAFYTERIHKNGRCYNIVYDCGSRTTYKVNKNKPILQAEIETFYNYTERINLLFISHFDNDHVNGLKYLKEHCNIQRVILPLIPTAAQWIYLSQLDEDLQLLMTNPKEFFGEETKITRVSYTTGSDIPSDDVYLHEEDGSEIPIITSGSRISSSFFDDWCYIPFNFNEEARYEKLLSLIATHKLDIDKLLKGDVDYIIGNRAKINKAYKDVVKKHGSSNESSLTVYSGPINTESKYIKKSISISNRSYFVKKYNPFDMHPFIRRVASLYLGDTDLNQISGGQSMMRAIYNSLREVANNIGTIQVPHHGSEKNFNDELLWYSCPKICFASFGKQNMYGHPSYRIVADIEMHNYFIGVTEDRNSAFVETITCY